MNLALFDFDGTITFTDTWSPFMRKAVPRARVIAGIVPMFPTALGYRLGMVSASVARQKAMRLGLRDADAGVIRRLGAEYAAAEIPGAVRPDALERIRWHQAQGDRIAVVSGSLDVYLDPWCRSLGIDRISTTLEERDGTLTGDLVGADCVGVEKAGRVRARYDLAKYNVIYAYGDTPDDHEMLAVAHRKFYRWKEIENGARDQAGRAL